MVVRGDNEAAEVDAAVAPCTERWQNSGGEAVAAAIPGHVVERRLFLAAHGDTEQHATSTSTASTISQIHHILKIILQNDAQNREELPRFLSCKLKKSVTIFTSINKAFCVELFYSTFELYICRRDLLFVNSGGCKLFDIYIYLKIKRSNFLGGY